MRDRSGTNKWLHELAAGKLSMEDTVKGYLLHYALNDLSISDVKRDILYHTGLGADRCQDAVNSLQISLKWYANREESRTITEVQQIVDCIRAGMDVQVAYCYPDLEEEDEYVVRKCW